MARADMIQIENVNGYRMVIRTEEKWFTRELLGNRCWGPGTTKYVKEHLGPGQVFVDVGAHIGYFTLLASGLVGKTGKVFAFEPDAESFGLLRYNITLNHCSNVMPLKLAIRDKHYKEAKLYGYGEPYQLYYTLSPDKAKHRPNKVTGQDILPVGEPQLVEVVTLDTIIPHKVDMIKIDVEGCEDDVLAGAVEIIKENPNIIVIVEGKGTKEWLYSLGFILYTISLLENNYAYQRPKGGTKGSIKAKESRRDPANDRPMVKQFTAHILGVPHTKTTMDHNCCAFTMKVLRWCDMMGGRGHKIYHYGTEGSEPPNAEQVDVLSDDIWQEVYGKVDYKKGFYKPDKKDRAYTTFNENAVAAIKERYQPGDIVIVTMGLWQKPVTDQLEGCILTELGVGYEGCYLPNKCFESYAWMHHHYGQKAKTTTANIRWFDAVIYNYYRPEDFPPRKDIITVPGKENYYFFIGRLTARKGPNIAQQVVDQLNIRGDKCKLVVAGQGDPWSVMDKSPNVEYVGTVNPQERSELMRKARATFVPSIYIEPFGSVVIESYWCGTPVISTDSGAFAETVLHGYTGYRCRTFDQWVWSADNWYRLDPFQIRVHAEDNYSYDIIGPMYEEYFQALTDLHSPGGWYTLHPDRTCYNWLQRKWPDGRLW